MAVLDIPVEQMTAEELLIEMVRPQIPESHNVRLRERLVETHAWMAKSLARRYSNRGEPPWCPCLDLSAGVSKRCSLSPGRRSVSR